jgi:hypothetical protein
LYVKPLTQPHPLLKGLFRASKYKEAYQAFVIPAEAGIHFSHWIPAFAGMTKRQDIYISFI